MKYYYEYKLKNGAKVAGHNVEDIQLFKNIVILKGVDIIPTYDDYDYSHWTQKLDMKTIEYLIIIPMEEDE